MTTPDEIAQAEQTLQTFVSMSISLTCNRSTSECCRPECTRCAARLVLAALAEAREKLARWDEWIRCAHCGADYQRTDISGQQAHIETCERHPLRAALAHGAAFRGKLVQAIITTRNAVNDAQSVRNYVSVEYRRQRLQALDEILAWWDTRPEGEGR